MFSIIQRYCIFRQKQSHSERIWLLKALVEISLFSKCKSAVKISALNVFSIALVIKLSYSVNQYNLEACSQIIKTEQRISPYLDLRLSGAVPCVASNSMACLNIWLREGMIPAQLVQPRHHWHNHPFKLVKATTSNFLDLKESIGRKLSAIISLISKPANSAT